MKSIEIKGTKRQSIGKKDAKSLRKDGKVPCVLYGGKETFHFAVEEKEFKDLVYTPEVKTVTLSLDGQEMKAVLQEIQFHPIKDNITHADFLAMTDEKEVKIEVPVKLTGTAAGVRAGGKLIKKQRLLKVRALPANLPDSIEVNVENLEVGQVIRVKNIEANEKVVLLNTPNTVIATVKGKRGGDAAPAAAAAGKK